jgi:hypothetical protein
MSDEAESKDQPTPQNTSDEARGKEPPAPQTGTGRTKHGRPDPVSARTMRTAALVGLALIAVVLGLMLLLDDSDDSSDTGAARIVSVEELQEAAADSEAPIYWAGAQDEAELELSQPDAARTFVRYLTGGAEAGAPGADYLTVGTYADDDPVSTLKRQGKEPGGVLVSAPGNATVYFERNNPHSVYVAYPGVAAQIEVYDPDFKRALHLVESGQIVSAG